ncbi:Retrovirus-related Pol polyprotein from transposon RE1 [Linum perenne]
MPFVDGTSSAPDPDDSTFTAWNRCNFVVLSWILNSVSEDIAQSLISYDNAAAVWKDLRQRFSQCDAIRIADIQARISSCDQGTNTVSQYYTNLKVLWEELIQYRPIPACDCSVGGSSCSVMKQVLLHRSEDYVIRFIRGLNSSFNVVRSQLLLMDPLPDINSAFKCAIQLERQMKGNSVPNAIESIALATNYQGRGKTVAESSLFCRYCKKTNHNIEDCLKLKNKKARMAGQSSSSGFAGSVNSSASGDSNGASSVDSVVSTNVHNGSISMSLSSEEFARLKLFLSQQSISNPNPVHATSAPLQTSGILALTSFAFKLSTLNIHEWIIDTGASDHICSSISILIDPTPISHVSVTLPKGSSLLATHEGSVKLSSHLQLSRVLYVPGFSFNPLSVSRLTQSMKISVEFCAEQCRIMDLLSQKMIGIAYQIRGLYLLLPDSLFPLHFFLNLLLHLLLFLLLQQFNLTSFLRTWICGTIVWGTLKHLESR